MLAPSLLAHEAPIDSAGAMARSRVLFGGAALWLDGGELAARYFVRYFGRDFGLSEPMLGASWLPAFTFLETGSVLGRAAPRAALAHGEVPDGVFADQDMGDTGGAC